MHDSKESDFGTPELQERGVSIGYNADGEKVASVSHQRRLDTLFKRGGLTLEQFSAGNALIRDAYYSGLQVSIKSACNYEITGNSGLDAQIDAKNRYFAALKQVTGYERAILQWVVLDDGYLKDLSPDKRYRVEASKVLADALDKLAVFYGIKTS